MKTMTCNQLGGACQEQFRAESFEKMAELSKAHGMEMVQKGDPDHINVMNQMKILMNDPKAMQEWYEHKQKEFDALPDER